MNNDSGFLDMPTDDKTFVEGSVDYAGIPEQDVTELLPSGNSPVPLGSGKVTAIIGSGGMAKVYKIWNEKLEMFRAVKVLIPGHEEYINRFETEAKITAKLHHQNIVEIYNVGEHNKLPFLEMEFVDGESLELFIKKKGKLPDVVCSAIAVFIVRALSYAHNQQLLIYGKNYHGIIHRDLKPANIMISKNGELRLMDFGIARPIEASLHTIEGNIVGTIQYLSPEQMDGFSIDCRTDIYSFGAILYEMLTGTKAFPQDTITDLMKKKIINEYRKFTDFDFEIYSELASISQRCLQFNKQDRYCDAESLLNELEIVHKSIASDPPNKVLRDYLSHPDSLIISSRKTALKRFNKKNLLPGIWVLLSAALVISVISVYVSIRKADYIPVLLLSEQAKASTVPLYVSTDCKKNSDSVFSIDFVPEQHSPAINLRTVKNPALNSQSKKLETYKKVLPEKSEFSQTESLNKKYPEKGLLDMGRNALDAGAFDDAILALNSIENDHPAKQLLLLEAYLKSGNTEKAASIVSREIIPDAQYYYLCGTYFEKTGKALQALEYYQQALTIPSSTRELNDIRNDALFNTAMLRNGQYRDNPTDITKFQALNAWNIVKKLYGNNPAHKRYIQAQEELARIQ